jgi:hypothetical protein
MIGPSLNVEKTFINSHPRVTCKALQFAQYFILYCLFFQRAPSSALALTTTANQFSSYWKLESFGSWQQLCDNMLPTFGFEFLKHVYIYLNFIINEKFYKLIYDVSRRREAPCEGTNSPRLFTPGETKALAKCKVHQWPRAWVTVSGSVGGHLTDLKNMVVCQEWRGNKYKKCMSESLENRFANKQIVKLFTIFIVNI